jgi:hypothetical protein
MNQIDDVVKAKVIEQISLRGFPEKLIPQLVFTKTQFKIGEDIHGNYKFFDCLDNPVIYFKDTRYNKQQVTERLSDYITPYYHEKIPRFHLSLNRNNKPCLEVKGDLATASLYTFLKNITDIDKISDELFDLNVDADAYFDIGSDNPEGKHFSIEFRIAYGAQRFIDYVNNHFRYITYIEPVELSKKEKA